MEKTVLRPVAKIEYLGVFVSHDGISQTPKITEEKKKLLDLLEIPLLLSSKQREVMAGCNNYFNMFVVHNATLNFAILKNVILVTKNLQKVTSRTKNHLGVALRRICVQASGEEQWGVFPCHSRCNRR